MKWLAFLLLVIASPAVAAPAVGPMHQYAKGEPVVIAPDAAYVLFRGDPHATQRNRLARFAFDFVLVDAKALTGAGESADPSATNVFVPRLLKSYDVTPDAEAVVISLPPGRYVLAGVMIKGAGAMGTCLCMGTVSFEAKPGVVTDLGYLVGEVDGLPPQAPEFAPTPYDWRTWGDVTAPVMNAAVRPATTAMYVPEALKGLRIVPADYRAFGKFPNYFGGTINRLTPLNNVLSYDVDRVVDLKEAR